MKAMEYDFYILKRTSYKSILRMKGRDNEQIMNNVCYFFIDTLQFGVSFILKVTLYRLYISVQYVQL